MNNTMFLTFCSLFYSILLLVFVLKKFRRKAEYKDKMYRSLIISNFFGIIIELICVYTCMNYKEIPVINSIALKGFLVYLLVWITFFTLYIFGISYTKQKILKLKKIVNIISMVLFIISTVLVIILPMEYFLKNDIIIYTYGMSVKFVYVISEILIILCLFFMFRNAKTFNGKKYAPLFIFIAAGAFIMIVQSMYPELLLMTSTETFITFLIYFTSEENKCCENLENKLQTKTEIQLGDKHGE